MSKKINTEKLNHVISECNENAKLVNMVNESGTERIKNGTMTEDVYTDIISANVNQGSKHVSAVQYGTGYLDGYRDCQKDTVNVALATMAGCAVGIGIIKYRKEIKEYGKYIKNKIFKKKDDAITFDENGNIIQ